MGQSDHQWTIASFTFFMIAGNDPIPLSMFTLSNDDPMTR